MPRIYALISLSLSPSLKSPSLAGSRIGGSARLKNRERRFEKPGAPRSFARPPPSSPPAPDPLLEFRFAHSYTDLRRKPLAAAPRQCVATAQAGFPFSVRGCLLLCAQVCRLVQILSRICALQIFSQLSNNVKRGSRGTDRRRRQVLEFPVWVCARSGLGRCPGGGRERRDFFAGAPAALPRSHVLAPPVS